MRACVCVCDLVIGLVSVSSTSIEIDRRASGHHPRPPTANLLSPWIDHSPPIKQPQLRCLRGKSDAGITTVCKSIECTIQGGPCSEKNGRQKLNFYFDHALDHTHSPPHLCLWYISSGSFFQLKPMSAIRILPGGQQASNNKESAGGGTDARSIRGTRQCAQRRESFSLVELDSRARHRRRRR